MKEGRDLLGRAATVAGADRQRALTGLGTIAFRQGDAEAAECAFLERLALVQNEGPQRELVDALSDLARIALRRSDFAGVRRYAERGYAAAEGLEREAIRMPLHMRAAAFVWVEGRALSERRRRFSRDRNRVPRRAGDLRSS